MSLRLLALIAIVVVVVGAAPAAAGPPVLRVEAGAMKRAFTATQLLADPATRTLEIPYDVAYGRPMRYRAIPLRRLLDGLPAQGIETLEARATNDFVAQIPWRLIGAASRGGAIPWIAIDDPAHPWPLLPGKTISAGPFALVWQYPERSKVAQEQWPFALASLSAVDDPVKRWPQLALPDGVPAGDPARRGQTVYIEECLPCHRMEGAGASDRGPDLGAPMPATAYMTKAGLAALIRNPKAVRTWPQQQMPGFAVATMSDADVAAVIAYLSRRSGVPAR